MSILPVGLALPPPPMVPTVQLDLPVEQAIGRLAAALAEEGMGLVSDVNVQASDDPQITVFRLRQDLLKTIPPGFGAYCGDLPIAAPRW
jgi:hypothetical protein